MNLLGNLCILFIRMVLTLMTQVKFNKQFTSPFTEHLSPQLRVVSVCFVILSKRSAPQFFCNLSFKSTINSSKTIAFQYFINSFTDISITRLVYHLPANWKSLVKKVFAAAPARRRKLSKEKKKNRSNNWPTAACVWVKAVLFALNNKIIN